MSNRTISLFGARINPDHIVMTSLRPAPFALSFQIVIGTIGAILTLLLLALFFLSPALVPLVEELFGPEVGEAYYNHQQVIQFSDHPLRDIFFPLHGALIVLVLWLTRTLGDLVSPVSKRVIVRLSNGRLKSRAMSYHRATILIAALEEVAKREVPGFDAFLAQGATFSYRAGDSSGRGNFDLGEHTYRPVSFPAALELVPTSPFDFVLRVFTWVFEHIASIITIGMAYNVVLWFFEAPSLFSLRDTGKEVFIQCFIVLVPMGLFFGLVEFVKTFIFARMGVDLSVLEFDGFGLRRRVLNTGGVAVMGWLQSGLAAVIKDAIGYRPHLHGPQGMWDLRNSSMAIGYLSRNHKTVPRTEPAPPVT